MDYEGLATRIKERIAQEWQAQGHTLTGAFEESLTHEIEEGENVTIRISGRHYGVYMQYGVKAEEIKYPFARKRIDALTNYVMLRMGLPEKMAKQVAGAIAYKHSKEGMPLPSSVRFSTTGKRIGFVSDARPDIVDMARQEILKIVKQEIYGNLIG